MQRLAGTAKVSRMEPRTLVLHAKPSLGRRDCRMSGKMMPPTPPAVVAMPVAKPLRALKKCAMQPYDGEFRKAPPRPPRTE
jgi:hypothetical protein